MCFKKQNMKEFIKKIYKDGEEKEIYLFCFYAWKKCIIFYFSFSSEYSFHLPLLLPVSHTHTSSPIHFWLSLEKYRLLGDNNKMEQNCIR